jgi:hypothetical protein
MEELKPYLRDPKTGRVYCAYCGANGFKPNKHGANAKTRTCAACDKKHKNESIDVVDKPSIQPTDDLELKELDQFIGTEGYLGVMGANCTDGVAYVMRNGYSWFVTDFIAVAKTHEKVKTEEFVCVDLKLDGTKAKMKVTDGNDNKLYEQDYDYTDAKRELKLFYTNNVLMLAREY